MRSITFGNDWFEIGRAQKFLRARRYRFEDGVPPMRCEDRKRIIELARLLDRFRPRLRPALLSHRAPEGGRKAAIGKTPHACLRYCQENTASPCAIVQIATNRLSRR